MQDKQERKSHTRVLAVLIGILSLAGVAGILVFNSETVEATSTANGTADAKATVITSISIGAGTDLNFGEAAQSDIAKTIDPSAAPTGAGTVTRAQWTVSGQASHSFAVSGLPASITLITGAGLTADTQIVVNAFNYFVTGAGANNTNGSLDGTGNRVVYIGATRAAIRATQTAGAYALAAGVTITVTYN